MASPVHELPPPRHRDARDRSLVELIRDLADETGTLVRDEIELAKSEVSQKLAQARQGAISLGAAAGLAVGAFAAVTACLILALATVMPAALAALIVAVLYGAGAAVMYARGRRQIKEAAPPTPQQTIDTVKEDVAWLRNRKSSASA